LDDHRLAAFFAQDARLLRAPGNDLAIRIALEVGGALAFGIVRTGEEFALFAETQHHLRPTLFAQHARLLLFDDGDFAVFFALEIAGKFALRVTRAGQVLTPASFGDLEFAPFAFGTSQVRRRSFLFERGVEGRLELVVE